jgi:UDP-N-acetylmuramate--alanine ligase
MIDFKQIKRVYFIGIGGIGMSAIVSGYDKTETALTRKLVEEGIEVHYIDDLDLVPKDADIIVYTPAIPSTHKGLAYLRFNNYTLLKRSEVLGLITEASFNICIAGTHGKTTISSMIAHLLRDSGYGCNAFLGGIAVNYNSNYWSNERNVCVIEADEYDRSFLRLHPDIALISAMDADHLEIYGDEESMRDAFVEFAGKIKAGGSLYFKKGIAREEVLASQQAYSYHFSDNNADVHAENIRMEEGSYHFDVVTSRHRLETFTLNMGGLHNIENMVAAIAVADQLEIEPEKIRHAVKSYRGVKRRFEYIIKGSANEGPVYIDDYAHHPEELKALLTGARKLFPALECIVIFQPHLFTRTRDFFQGFAEALDMADQVALLPIYPAREMPIEGVTSDIILNAMNNQRKQIVAKELVPGWLMTELDEHGVKGKLVITAGAGDIDTLIEPIKEVIGTLN